MRSRVMGRRSWVCGLAIGAGLLPICGWAEAIAQPAGTVQVTGELGSPSATTTISGRQLPARIRSSGA